MGIKQARGGAGEAMAAAFLELEGWSIVERNARLGGVQVDLVADDGPVRVVVEVKFRARSDYGGAALAVERTQRERLIRAARAIGSGGRRVRIDLVAIERLEDSVVLRRYENAIMD